MRGGYDDGSGDSDSSDQQHGTFFQTLPTPRLYARLPFFNMMNNGDAFGEVMLRPSTSVTVRTDVHAVRLADKNDLWYSGGGAQNDDLFGFAGTPAQGRHDLAQLVDLSATIAVARQLTLAGYYGHAFGGDVVGATFAGRGADYGFLEMTLRY